MLQMFLSNRNSGQQIEYIGIICDSGRQRRGFHIGRCRGRLLLFQLAAIDQFFQNRPRHLNVSPIGIPDNHSIFLLSLALLRPHLN